MAAGNEALKLAMQQDILQEARKQVPVKKVVVGDGSVDECVQVPVPEDAGEQIMRPGDVIDPLSIMEAVGESVEAAFAKQAEDTRLQGEVRDTAVKNLLESMGIASGVQDNPAASSNASSVKESKSVVNTKPSPDQVVGLDEDIQNLTNTLLDMFM